MRKIITKMNRNQNHQNQHLDHSDHLKPLLNEPFEDFNTSFADFPRYGTLTKLSRNLEKFALLVAGGRPLPELGMRFIKVRSIKLKNLTINLENTRHCLLQTERLYLTDEDRNIILNEVLTARKLVAKQVIEEGAKSTLVVGYAQFVNLVRAWRVVRGANVLANKDYVQVEILLQQTIRVCEQTKLLMALYAKYPVDSNARANVLEMLKVKTMEIQVAYRKCVKLIANLKSGLLTGIVSTQLVEMRHNEGALINPQRAKKTLSLDCLFESITLLVPIGYMCAALLNPKVSYRAGQAKAKLKLIKAKLGQLEHKLCVIEQTKREAEKFLLLEI